jgi:hypothetical protein
MSPLTKSRSEALRAGRCARIRAQSRSADESDCRLEFAANRQWDYSKNRTEALLPGKKARYGQKTVRERGRSMVTWVLKKNP